MEERDVGYTRLARLSGINIFGKPITWPGSITITESVGISSDGSPRIERCSLGSRDGRAAITSGPERGSRGDFGARFGVLALYSTTCKILQLNTMHQLLQAPSFLEYASLRNFSES